MYALGIEPFGRVPVIPAPNPHDQIENTSALAGFVVAVNIVAQIDTKRAVRPVAPLAPALMPAGWFAEQRTRDLAHQT